MTTDTLDTMPAAAGAVVPSRPAVPAQVPPSRRAVVLLVPAAAIVAWAVHRYVPDRQSAVTAGLYARLLLAAAATAGVVAAAERLRPARWCAGLADRLVRDAPLAAAALLVLAAWDLVTLKQLLAPVGLPLPLPYFPGPDLVVQSLRDDWPLILNCAWHSLLLLLGGYATGVVLGVTSGVLIGWSPAWRYWGMPVLKVVGPIPATAFIPLALMLFPTAFSSAVALITLAVWFPVTMLTASGVANVRRPLLDVARTLGASPAFLVFRVAIPSALPSLFVGLFMGLGTSFLTLVVAETVGVSSGLGWYINWAKAWADYPKVYAALVVMAVFFSGLMTLLFKVRDRVLVYQKGTIQW